MLKVEYKGKISYSKEVYDLKKELIESVNYLSKKNIKLLCRACDFANDAHYGQFRQSGDMYITHPISVAIILSNWKVDIETLQAALLHDVIEDTKITKEEITDIFGINVANLVDGVSKLEKFKYHNYKEHQAESFQKMILAVVKDLRVLIIKLADRFHNMSTLDFMRPDKQKRISRETMEIYSLLAFRIGLTSVCDSLQNLSFKYLYPLRYKIIKEARTKFEEENSKEYNIIANKIKESFNAYKINIKLEKKNLTPYKIYHSMLTKKINFKDIFDHYTIIVIVDSVMDCYTSLGIFHSIFKPKVGKIRDYIAIPRQNGYQSLHTTLFGIDGKLLKIYIRTKEMNKVAKLGVLYNWFGSSASDSDNSPIEITRKEWLKNIEYLKDKSDDAIDFFKNVIDDLNIDELYLFTPKGKIIVLPKNATPIDFAYAIHTDIGNHCVAAKVDNHLVPLKYSLKTGQTVEIITDKARNPNPSWITFVVSSRARSAIRNKIRSMNRNDAIVLGEKLLSQVLYSLLPEDIVLSDKIKEKYLLYLYSKNLTFEDILYDIGMGRALPTGVVIQILDLAGKEFEGKSKLNPITITGNSNSYIKLATCCNPIPGDKITSIIVKDQGLIVHKIGCSNLTKINPLHYVEADWDTISYNQKFKIKLLITSKDEKGLLAQISNAIFMANANIELVETPSKKQSGLEGFIEFLFEIEINAGLEQLEKITKSLYNISAIHEIKRL